MRITVPEGKRAIVLSEKDAKDLYNMCRLIRQYGARAFKQANNDETFREIAGETMLSYIDGIA